MLFSSWGSETNDSVEKVFSSTKFIRCLDFLCSAHSLSLSLSPATDARERGEKTRDSRRLLRGSETGEDPSREARAARCRGGGRDMMAPRLSEKTNRFTSTEKKKSVSQQIRQGQGESVSSTGINSTGSTASLHEATKLRPSVLKGEGQRSRGNITGEISCVQSLVRPSQRQDFSFTPPLITLPWIVPTRSTHSRSSHFPSWFNSLSRARVSFHRSVRIGSSPSPRRHSASPTANSSEDSWRESGPTGSGPTCSDRRAASA
jgi:hypothetical protein